MYLRRRILATALRPVVAFVARSEPPLDHVRLCARSGELEMIATDGATTLHIGVPCEGGIFDAVLPAHELLTFIRGAVREAIIELVKDGNRVDVAFELCLSSFESRRIDDVPFNTRDSSVKWSVEAKWDARALRDALTWVLPAVGRDPTRPTLSSVLFDKEHVVGTDGHRLHAFRLPGIHGEPIVIASNAAAQLKRMLAHGEIVLERAGENVRFVATGWRLETRLPDARFPPYERVIPSRDDESCHVEVEAILAAVALKTIVQPVGFRPQSVQMAVNGQLTLEHRDDNNHVSRAAIPTLRSTHKGDDLSLGVCARHLADALVGDGTRTLRFGGPLDPIVVESPNGRLAVVMPMRL